MVALDSNLVTDALISRIKQLGIFDDVVYDYPSAAPNHTLLAIVWEDSDEPVKDDSGLDVVSMRLNYMIRIMRLVQASPGGGIHRDMINARNSVREALYTDLDLTVGDLNLEIDIYGFYGGVGSPSQSGFVPVAGSVYRVIDMQTPIIVRNVYPLQE